MVYLISNKPFYFGADLCRDLYPGNFFNEFLQIFFNCEICASELQLLLLQCFHEFSLLSACYSQQKG